MGLGEMEERPASASERLQDIEESIREDGAEVVIPVRILPQADAIPEWEGPPLQAEVFLRIVGIGRDEDHIPHGVLARVMDEVRPYPVYRGAPRADDIRDGIAQDAF